MNWLVLISFFIVIPGVMLKPYHNTKINRVINIINNRKYMDYDHDDPVQVMRALNSLPENAGKFNYKEYVQSENARLKKQFEEHPEMLALFQKRMEEMKQKQQQYQNQNQLQNIPAPTPVSRKMTDYVMKQIQRALQRDEQHDPPKIERRRHHHPYAEAYNTMREIQQIPDLEEMLPASYVQKHKKEFKKFHSNSGIDVRKIINQKNAKSHREPEMEYAEMTSMNKLAKARKSAIDDLVENYLRKQRQSDHMNTRKQYDFVPVLSKKQEDHVGNSLFFINKKRILGSHLFPEKETSHSVYGNLQSLGLTNYPGSNELKYKKINKLIKNTPIDAEDQPWRLYDHKHPGLNLLYEKKMNLDSAKFRRPKKHLVYGNPDSVGKININSDRQSDHRHMNSDFRKYGNMRKSSFYRPNNGRFNVRPLKGSYSFEVIGLDEPIYHSSKPKLSKISHHIKKKKLKNKYNKTTKNKPSFKSIGPKRTHYKPKIYVIRPLARYEYGKLKHHDKPEKEEDYAMLVYGNFDNTGIRYGNAPYRLKYSDFKRKLRDGSGDNNNESRLVYGNTDNFSIRYSNTPYRLKYSDFRKHNNQNKGFSNSESEDRDQIESQEYDDYDTAHVINEAVKAIHESNKKHYYSKYGRLSDKVAIGPADLDAKNIKYRLLKHYLEDEVSENENDAKEMFDMYDDDPNLIKRRSSKGREKYASYEKKAARNGTALCEDDASSSSASSSASGDKNPGNPYTLFKSKYRQNWLWNHVMDGDHMNINPYGPKFDSLGPTGHELFFGRKWWYFNQDDYKPFRKR